MTEYIEPLNNGPVVSGGYAGSGEVNKMRDLLSILGNPADQSDFGGPAPRQIQRQPIANNAIHQRRIPQQNYNHQNGYIPAMNEVGLNESTNYDDYMVNNYDNNYDFSSEPQQYHQPTQQYRQPINEDVSFISNKNARTSVEKYLNRGMNLFSNRVQEIISIDESLVALRKDSVELKERHAKCKELKLVEAGQVFAKQFKETGAKIKILELQLKNINDSINDF